MTTPIVLRTVTDRFSILNSGRKYSDQNNRNYLISHIRNLLESPLIKERLKYRELLGYFGHGNRALFSEMYDTPELPPTMVLMIDGKPVNIVNIPSNVTVACSIDNDGIVTHTQDILDNESGQIVDSLEKALVGGWSWVTRGGDNTISKPTKFFGLDYVYNNNFISLDREYNMFESSGNNQEMSINALIAKGIKPENAKAIVSYLDQDARNAIMYESVHVVPNQQFEILSLYGRQTELENELAAVRAQLAAQSRDLNQNKLMMESVETARQRQKRIFESAPVFLTSKQIETLINPQSEQDVQDGKLIFESVKNADLNQFPLHGNKREQQKLITSLNKKYYGESEPLITSKFDRDDTGF